MAFSFTFTLTIRETPGSPMVTPYKTSTLCMVFLMCVIKMNCELCVIVRIASL